MTLGLLHTADWHLGHTLHGIERTYEHEKLVAWVLDTIERESVDAVLIAGDVFDGANPPTEAQALWYRFLVESWRRVPHLQARSGFSSAAASSGSTRGGQRDAFTVAGDGVDGQRAVAG